MKRPGQASTVVLLLAVGGACAAPADPVDNRTQLDAVVQRYVESQRGGGGQRSLAAETFLAEIEADRAFLADVETIGSDGLSLEEDIDRRLLVGLLRSSIHSADSRRTWENDPSMYVPSGQIGRLLGPDANGTPGERATRLVEALSRMPEMFDHARANLGRPPRLFTDEAIFQTTSLLESVREGIAALDEQVDRDLTTDTAGYVAVLDDHLAYLRDDVLPRSDGDWAIGKEAYDVVLQERWFLDADADAILARGWRAFEETEALAEEVADRMSPGSGWVEIYERLKDDHPPADDIKQAYQEQMNAAQRFVVDNAVLTLPEGEHVITVDTPPARRRSSPFGTFQPVSAFGDGLEGRLVLTPIEDWMTPEQRAERLRSHHTAWIPIIAVHEAYPGHHAQALKLRENPRMLRKAVSEPIFSEGWGLFTEELMFELGFLTGDDVRLTVLRNRLWRAARVILDVSLHTGRMTIDEAVDFLVERVRFERYAAELEVGMYPRRPTYVLGYLIGMQEIEAIRDDYVEAFGAPDRPADLYDRLLRIGSIPPALVREELFGQAR